MTKKTVHDFSRIIANVENERFFKHMRDYVLSCYKHVNMNVSDGGRAFRCECNKIYNIKTCTATETLILSYLQNDTVVYLRICISEEDHGRKSFDYVFDHNKMTLVKPLRNSFEICSDHLHKIDDYIQFYNKVSDFMSAYPIPLQNTDTVTDIQILCKSIVDNLKLYQRELKHVLTENGDSD